MKPSLLIVDDDPAVRSGFSRFLSKTCFNVEEAESIAQARGRLARQRCDVVLVTERDEVPLAVEAMRRGADHFFTKPVSLTDLEIFLLKSLELGTLRKSRNAQSRLTRTASPYSGDSPAGAQLREMAGLAARSESPVVLQVRRHRQRCAGSVDSRPEQAPP